MKHDLYARYLDRWWPIMVQGWGGNVTYAEGFAGPGFYEGGEDGSPVIALRVLLEHGELAGHVSPARLLFVDADKRCVQFLGPKLRAAAGEKSARELLDRGILVDIVHGMCEPELERLLTRHDAWGHPVLAVLDTFGGSVGADLLRRIAGNPGSEVIVTMLPQYFSRFAQADEIQHGDRVFGSTDWREVADVPSDERTTWLLRRYRRTVADAGFRYLLDFELVDARGVSLYLVFGTNHERGLEKMKDAMWEVDPEQGVGYRDPRDPGQETLPIAPEPHTAPLRRRIMQYMQELPRSHRVRVHDLRAFTLYETTFRAPQVMPVLTDLCEQGQLSRTGQGRLFASHEVWLP